jgi:two-component system C4-dicarboxylate transport sensor histidine kinase DctB
LQRGKRHSSIWNGGFAGGVLSCGSGLRGASLNTGLRGVRLWSFVLLITLSALCLWQVHAFALRQNLQNASARSETALRLSVNALEADLALLASYNDRLLSSDIYIMRADGVTIAASNHDRNYSFIGHNFSYRPYFLRAMAGHGARFFGIGTTSGVRGYFFSAPIRNQTGKIAGVIAVKIGVSRIEAAWQGVEYRILVTDQDGIAFMSSVPDWLYGSTVGLNATPETERRDTRRYSDASVHDLGVVHRQLAAMPLLQIPARGATPAAEYVANSQSMEKAGWTVHVLLDTAGAHAEARATTIAALVLLCALVLVAAVVLQRRARIAERIRLAADAKTELETRVRERTADLARVNSHLEQEITERRATEADLRAAQANLLRVGKLAALGQMSATLSHEVNQPLAAARNYADSAGILIERGEYGRARENLTHILTLIDRMAMIGRHLRDAARKPNDRRAPVNLQSLLSETEIILGGRLAAARLSLELDIPADLPPVLAGATRLQQVLVNLISNAIDASEAMTSKQPATGQGPRPAIILRAGPGEARKQDNAVKKFISISVRDFGPGVPAAIADRIFDPFFTTKGMGAGLGLGLSISYNIIRDFGGEIILRKCSPGAEFIVNLPAAATGGPGR